MKHIVERELLCRCQKCEGAVQDILRMELMLCQGAKVSLARRRKEIQREKRAPYFRERAVQRRGKAGVA
jgi:hypothetical protein